MTYPAWIRYLLAVSLALNLGVVAALVLRPALVAPPAGDAPAVIDLPDYLQLTAGQRARWYAKAIDPRLVRRALEIEGVGTQEESSS